MVNIEGGGREVANISVLFLQWGAIGDRWCTLYNIVIATIGIPGKPLFQFNINIA